MNAKITFPELVELMAKATSTTQRMCVMVKIFAVSICRGWGRG